MARLMTAASLNEVVNGGGLSNRTSLPSGTDADALPWWEPQSFMLALLLAIISTVCWGSWSNTAKAAGKNLHFAHYYADFCIGTLLAAVLLLVLPGQSLLGRPNEVDPQRCLFAIAAGGIFGVANLLLTTGIALAGLAVAFPICIGTGLVLGTALTYVVDQRGRPLFLFTGVFLALLGVLANAQAYHKVQQERQRKGTRKERQGDMDSDTAESSEEQGDVSSKDSDVPSAEESEKTSEQLQPVIRFPKLLVLCVVGGLLMGSWAPLNSRSMQGRTGLSPYASFALFTGSSFVVSITLLALQQLCTGFPIPRIGTETTCGAWTRTPLRQHCWGLLGGLIWAIGTGCNSISGKRLGFALSFALGQTAPMVAVLWGLVWYHEFDGAPSVALWWLVLMFLFFGAAIALIVLGGTE